MTTYEFTVKEHEEFGGLGFAPSWYPNGDPLGGMGVAHDILEHFPNDDGGAEGEFMALGCSYRLRGETGYMQRNGNVNRPEVHLASDFEMIFQAIEEMNGHTRIKPCPHTVDLDDEVIDAFREIVRLAKKNFRDNEWPNPIDPRDEKSIVAWMAYGYHKAGVRYEGHEFYDLAYRLFNTIEERADVLLKGAEEGMKLIVRVDVPEYEAHLVLDYEDY